MTTVTNFLGKHANYIWTTSALHRKENLAKIQVFLDYDNNAVKRVDEISGADIIDFCHWLKDTRKISENTINHYRSALSRYFNYAKDYLDLPKIPNIKFVKVTNQRVRFYSRTEIKKLENIYVVTSILGYYQCLISASPHECGLVKFYVFAEPM